MRRQKYWWWGKVKTIIYRYGKTCIDKGRHIATIKIVSFDREVIRKEISKMPEDLREYAAVTHAISETLSKDAGSDRLMVVRRVLMDQTHTLEGAAHLIPCHYKTALQYQNEFIKLVAWYLSLVS